MAFEAFIPATVHLQGSDALLEGLTYRRTFIVKRSVNGVDTPVNMTEYDAVAPTIVFKNTGTQAGGTTTGCPTGVCVWVDAAGGQLQLDVDQAATNPPAQIFSGIYEITVKHDTETDAGPVPKKAMTFTGNWAVTPTATATA